MRLHPRAHLGVALLASLLVLSATVSALTALGPAEQSLATTHRYLPSLHSRGFEGLLNDGSIIPAGMEGFGYSDIELQDRSGEANSVEMRMKTSHHPEVVLTRQLRPQLGDSVKLKEQRPITLGRYAAVMGGEHPFGAIGRTTWDGGAAAAYEAPPASSELIMPLLARDIYSHTTIYIAQNPQASDDPNEVKFRVFDNEDGAPILSLTVRMQPESVVIYDTYFNELQFRDLPVNSAGGSIATMRISAEEPVAVMAYGDEMLGDGTSAYGVRPASAASTQHFLPVVRANYLGDSLIAIANGSMTNDAHLTITYRGHEPGVAGRGETFTQPLTISARGSAFIDMSNLGRGTRNSPLPRGSGTNRGFFGSAVINSDQPIMAVVQEEARHQGTVRAVASYNSFGAGDMSTHWAVARVHNPASGRRTYVVLMNPGDQEADVGLTNWGVGGMALGSSRVSVPAKGVRIITPDRSLPEESQLAIASNRMVAALVYETTLHGPGDWGRWGQDSLIYRATALITDYETPTPRPVTDTPTPTQTATPTETPRPTNTPSASPTGGPDLDHRAYLPVTFRNYP